MTAQSALLELVGGVTLLLWATRLIRTGVERAFGEKLKVVVSQASGNRFRAAATGLLARYRVRPRQHC
jgi:phosphate:Na+ symporter